MPLLPITIEMDQSVRGHEEPSLSAVKVVQGRGSYLLKHGLPELQLFAQRLAAVLQVNACQRLRLQLALRHSVSVLRLHHTLTTHYDEQSQHTSL